MHASVEELQAALDGWVAEYNTERPHQSCGRRPPAERFALAKREPVQVAEPAEPVRVGRRGDRRPAGVSRWVDGNGQVSLTGFKYRVGPTFAGEPREVVVLDGLVQIMHAGVLVATHAQRLRPDQADRVARIPQRRRARTRASARNAPNGPLLTLPLAPLSPRITVPEAPTGWPQ